MIDRELESLGLHALKEEFCKSYSALTNGYVHAAKDLHGDNFLEMLAEISVYSTDYKMDFSEFELNIHGESGSIFGTTGYSTLKEAFEHNSHKFIYINGKRYFEINDDGEYIWCAE